MLDLPGWQLQEFAFARPAVLLASMANAALRMKAIDRLLIWAVVHLQGTRAQQDDQDAAQRVE